jgi:hypothetical protein
MDFILRPSLEGFWVLNRFHEVSIRGYTGGGKEAEGGRAGGREGGREGEDVR